MPENQTEPRAPQQKFDATLLSAETLRNTALAGVPLTPPKGEDRLPVFWRVFGATILSIGALVVITLCQHFNSSLNDLRGEVGRLNEDLHKDLAHLNENQSHLVLKEEFNTRLTSVWSNMKELQTLSSTVAALKEKDLVREEQLRHQEERKELVRELQLLRERLATLEGRQGAAPSTKPVVTPAENGLSLPFIY